MSDSEEPTGFDLDTIKVIESVGRIIDICHERLLDSTKQPVAIDEMHKLVVCLREAWLMSGTAYRIFSVSNDDDVSDGFPDEEDEDGPPFPMK